MWPFFGFFVLYILHAFKTCTQLLFNCFLISVRAAVPELRFSSRHLHDDRDTNFPFTCLFLFFSLQVFVFLYAVFTPLCIDDNLE